MYYFFEIWFEIKLEKKSIKNFVNDLWNKNLKNDLSEMGQFSWKFVKVHIFFSKPKIKGARDMFRYLKHLEYVLKQLVCYYFLNENKRIKKN